MANLKKGAEVAIIPERTHFQHMLAKNPNYFGNIPGSTLKPVYKLIGDTTYEQITCVGYNPDSGNMEATIAIHQPVGYNGDLCTPGSFEYLRFYLDCGTGLVDQGMVAINVHDIPVAKDCAGDPIFPLIYVATLPKACKDILCCETPLLPKLQVILSWSVPPPPNAPGWAPVWGNVVQGEVQIKPKSPWLCKLLPLSEKNNDLSTFLELALNSPNLSTNQVAEISGTDLNQLNPKPAASSLAELAKGYAKAVPAKRFALKTVSDIIQNPTSEASIASKAALVDLKIDVDAIIDEYAVAKSATQADVNWEQLDCIGLDYNTESLVATINIKQRQGYDGNLCTAGSYEYVAFWIDWGMHQDKCQWQYLNTLKINVHDINFTGNGLYYSCSLPIDADTYRQICNNPYIVRVRGVLSWSIAPSTTNPNLLNTFGNLLDAHVQIRPGISITPGVCNPIFTAIGGIEVGNISNTTGLTLAGATFIYSFGYQVPASCPFGGQIIINGLLYTGMYYTVKVTNLTNASSYYLNNKFYTESSAGSGIWYPQVPIGNVYAYAPFGQNFMKVLAQFSPGTNDLLKVEITTYHDVAATQKCGEQCQLIQMNNTPPAIQLTVNDNSNCKFYKEGDKITGEIYAYSKYMQSWSFGSTWGGNSSGPSSGIANTLPLPGNAFTVPTSATSYPCGNLELSAWDLTIVNSLPDSGPNNVGWGSYTHYNICLQ